MAHSLRRVALILVAALLFAAASTHADQRPNIVVIMVDDMGFSDIGPYGSEIPTPHLDALARGGVKFSQFYNTGRCCPTRASLLTGLTSHQAGIGWMTNDQNLPGYRGFLSDDCVTIAEVLRDAGYFTAMTGKWHVGHDVGQRPVDRGFDRSLNTAAGGLHFSNQTGPKGDTRVFLDGEVIARDDPRLQPPWYGTDLWTRTGIEFVDAAIDNDQPFFWYLAHIAPHFPCMAPRATIAKHRGRYLDGWDVIRQRRHDKQIESGLMDPAWEITSRPEAIPAWESLSKSDRIRYDDMMAIYAAMIDRIDDSVGEVVQSLEQRGVLDNTLILFLSDNGGNAESGVPGRYQGNSPGDPHSNVFIGQCWAHLNNTPFRKYKHYNHEGGIATPLIAHWPAGIQNRSPTWIDTPTHVVDLMMTCIDAAGTVYPSQRNDRPVLETDGVSLLPLITGTGDLPSRTLYWEHEGNAAVRIGDHKLVRVSASGPWELYDLAADRTEQHDLAPDQPDRVKSMRQKWRDWATSHQVLPKPAAKKRSPKRKKAP